MEVQAFTAMLMGTPFEIQNLLSGGKSSQAGSLSFFSKKNK